MKRIIGAGLVFCLALLGKQVAWGAAVQTGGCLRVARVLGSLGFPRTGIVGSVFSRIGRRVADKKKDERTASPVRSYKPRSAPIRTPARKPSAPRSAPPVSRPKPRTINRSSIRTLPRRSGSVSRPPSRGATPTRRTTRTFPRRSGSPSPPPSRRATPARRSTTRPSTTSSRSRPRAPTLPAASTSPLRTIGRSVREAVHTRTRTPPQRSPTTRTLPMVGFRASRQSNSTGTASSSSGATRSSSRGYNRLPGMVGRQAPNVEARSSTNSSTARPRGTRPYVSSTYPRGSRETLVTSRFSYGHAGRYVTSRFSQGHAGRYVTSRFSQGHAGRYVTSRFSQGHAGRYVTSRFSQGHAGRYVTSRFSGRRPAGTYVSRRYGAGHGISSTPSRWYYRAQRLQRYRRYYRYYGRDSHYYLCHGRWLPIPPGHIHGPGCGHVFRGGRWLAIESVPYPVFVPAPAYADYYYAGGWHAEPPVYLEEGGVVPPAPEPASEYVSVRAKAERELEVITRAYDLDWWEARRVEKLISEQVIEGILAGGEAGEESGIVFDKGKQRLVITGTPDDIMRVRTIIDDDRTYKLFTQEDMGGLVADAVPLVDLQFVESDPSAALRIAADNYSGADEILRSSEVSPSGREWWFNDRIGTMTVKDSADNLDALYDFMETRPYFR